MHQPPYARKTRLAMRLRARRSSRRTRRALRQAQPLRRTITTPFWQRWLGPALFEWRGPSSNGGAASGAPRGWPAALLRASADESPPSMSGRSCRAVRVPTLDRGARRGSNAPVEMRRWSRIRRSRTARLVSVQRRIHKFSRHRGSRWVTEVEQFLTGAPQAPADPAVPHHACERRHRRVDPR